MNIALVSPYDYSHPGGVTVHIMNLERQLSRKGHRVRILAPCSRKEGHLSPNLIPVGRAIPVPSGGSLARISLSFRLSGPVRKVLEEERFDIVHLHEPLTPMLPLMVLHLATCPKIGTFHAYHEKPRGYWLTKPVLKHWFHKLDGLIAVSIPARDFVARHFPGDYEIIPNGVDIARFSPKVPPKPELCDDKKNILFVGRPEPRKGVSFLIRAFQEIKRQFPKSRLVLAGPGKLLWLRYKEATRDIPDIVFAGYIPYEDLPSYYSSAYVLCAPATGEESFGIVLLEAMACGKPVVATAIPGYTQVVTHGEEGLLIPPRNEKAIIRALLELLYEPERAAKMGQRGRERAIKYSWEAITEKLLQYYQRFL